MSALDKVRLKIRELYENDPNIHISITLGRPKLCLKSDPAVIIGIYPNIFRIEEYSDGEPKCHTLQYTDILTGQIAIDELLL